VNFLLGADPDEPKASETNQMTDQEITIYQGHHGNTGAASADYVLPSTCYVEKNGSFVNFQGFLQQTQKALASKDKAFLRVVQAKEYQARDD
jgi:NADH dehydrogenase/NADH:ubiquinone oxidoreductase subunit G